MKMLERISDEGDGIRAVSGSALFDHRCDETTINKNKIFCDQDLDIIPRFYAIAQKNLDVSRWRRQD